MTVGRNIEARFKGAVLEGGWRVLDKCDPPRDGRYSIGFIAQNERGQKAFVKVLDYSYYLIDADPARVLKAALDAFLDERRLLETAKTSSFDRVVRIYNSGIFRDSEPNPLQYLIMELAEDDARCQMDLTRRQGHSALLTIVHHVTTGLRQLHSRDIAHQDLKAANVLLFNNGISKIGDLGSAGDQEATADHMEHDIAGDANQAPPELLYGFRSGEWHIRRTACDLYLLGSLIVSLYTGVGLTPLILAKLAPEHQPDSWKDSYYDVLVYLRHAFEIVMREFTARLREEIHDEVVVHDLSSMVHQLCDPDPMVRGEPNTRLIGKLRYNLERYISRLDYLAKRMAIKAPHLKAG